MNGPGYRTLLMHSYILLWHVRNALQRKLVHSQQQVRKLQWSHQRSVAMKTLWMELLHTQEADNCYSQNISYGFFQFLDLSLEVQTATKNQTQTQVMSVGVQMIYIYRYILNCMLPYPPQLLSPYSHSHVLCTVCWRGAQFLTYCTTLCTLCGKSSQPFSTWPSIYHMRWLKTSYSKQFTASICIQAIQAESKNTIGEGGCGLCLLNTLLSYLLIVLGRIHRFLCRLGQQLG